MAGLDEQQTQKLIGIMESEVASAFERIHAQGQGLPANFGAIFGDAMKSTLRPRGQPREDWVERDRPGAEHRSLRGEHGRARAYPPKRRLRPPGPYCCPSTARIASSGLTRWSEFFGSSAIESCTPLTSPLNALPTGP